MTTQSEKLKACPFCGSADVEPTRTVHHWIVCNQCGSEGPDYATEAEAIAAWNTRPLSMTGEGWQPIETAPKDGTTVLAIVEGVHPDSGESFVPEVVHWAGHDWWNESWSYDSGTDYEPTHWQPLPEPPAAIQEQGE